MNRKALIGLVASLLLSLGITVTARSAEQAPEDRLTTALAKLPGAVDALHDAIRSVRTMSMRTGATEHKICLRKTVASIEQLIVDYRIVDSQITLAEFSRLRRSNPVEARALAEELMAMIDTALAQWNEDFVPPQKCLFEG